MHNSKSHNNADPPNITQKGVWYIRNSHHAVLILGFILQEFCKEKYECKILLYSLTTVFSRYCFYIPLLVLRLASMYAM